MNVFVSIEQLRQYGTVGGYQVVLVVKEIASSINESR